MIFQEIDFSESYDVKKEVLVKFRDILCLWLKFRRTTVGIVLQKRKHHRTTGFVMDVE